MKMVCYSNKLALLANYGGIILAILKSIIGDFLSTAQKHNAQFLEHNSLMSDLFLNSDNIYQ